MFIKSLYLKNFITLEGMRVAAPSSGNDLLIERECSQVSLAAAAVSAPHWRECRDRAHGGFDAAGRGLSTALAYCGARNVWTPYARFDQVVPIELARSQRRLTATRVARGVARRVRAVLRYGGLGSIG